MRGEICIKIPFKQKQIMKKNSFNFNAWRIECTPLLLMHSLSVLSEAYKKIENKILIPNYRNKGRRKITIITKCFCYMVRRTIFKINNIHRSFSFSSIMKSTAISNPVFDMSDFSGKCRSN